FAPTFGLRCPGSRCSPAQPLRLDQAWRRPLQAARWRSEFWAVRVEQRRRRPLSAARVVVAGIDPDAPGVRLALSRDRNLSVAVVQANGCQNVSLDQRAQRSQG